MASLMHRVIALRDGRIESDDLISGTESREEPTL
jgi:hypothetical protein